jgi:hypothetical protein
LSFAGVKSPLSITSSANADSPPKEGRIKQSTMKIEKIFFFIMVPLPLNFKFFDF